MRPCFADLLATADKLRRPHAEKVPTSTILAVAPWARSEDMEAIAPTELMQATSRSVLGMAISTSGRPRRSVLAGGLAATTTQFVGEVDRLGPRMRVAVSSARSEFEGLGMGLGRAEDFLIAARAKAQAVTDRAWRVTAATRLRSTPRRGSVRICPPPLLLARSLEAYLASSTLLADTPALATIDLAKEAAAVSLLLKDMTRPSTIRVIHMPIGDYGQLESRECARCSGKSLEFGAPRLAIVSPPLLGEQWIASFMTAAPWGAPTSPSRGTRCHLLPPPPRPLRRGTRPGIVRVEARRMKGCRVHL